MVDGYLAIWTFGLTGIMGIVGGGLLSAFSAKSPTRLASWMSAYLVLIVGFLQLVLGFSLSFLVPEEGSIWLSSAFLAYNLGNANVILGTVYKKQTKNLLNRVNLGGFLLAASILILALGLVNQTRFSWQLIVFDITALTILISMPIGLVLSQRRNH